MFNFIVKFYAILISHAKEKPVSTLRSLSGCYLVFISCLLLNACQFDRTGVQNKPQNNHSAANKLQEMELAIQNNPDSADLRLEYITQLLKESKGFSALAQYDTIILKNPNNVVIYNLRAATYLELSDTGSAINDYEKALLLDPHSDALFNLAYLYALQGNVKALEICDQMIRDMDKRNPSADPYFIKGIYFLRLKDTVSGLEAMKESINTDHNFMEAYIEKGKIHFFQNHIQEAHKTFTLATKVDADYAEAYYWLARCEAILHNLPAAKAMYKKCLELDPAYIPAKEALEKL